MAGNNSGVSINFSARGTDLLSFMDRMKERANTMATSMLENARRQSTSARDQIRSIEDEIKALERKSRLETQAAVQLASQRRQERKDAASATAEQRANKINEDFAAGKFNRSRKDSKLRDVDTSLARENSNADNEHKEEVRAIRELSRDTALQTSLLRETIESIRTAQTANVNAIRSGDDTIVDSIGEVRGSLDELARTAAEEEFDEEEEKKRKQKEKEEGKSSTFSDLMKTLAIDRGLGLVSGMPGAKNELDFIKPIMSMIGMTLGGVAGNIVDMANVKILGTGAGNSNWSGLGMQIGEKAGEFFGTALERSYRGRDELTTRNFKLQAATGLDLGIDAIGGKNGVGGTGLSSVIADLSEYGSDFKETADLMYKAATARASGGTMGEDAEKILALQQGLGVQEQTSLALMELQRSSKDQNRDIMKLVGGVARAGDNNIFSQDRTFLNEFLSKNFISLQHELLRSQDHVASGTTFDILKRFNSVGGQFEARDPRSTGLISTINSSLVNPGSDNLKAMSFMAMRNANPTAGISQLLEEQQKGLSSSTYMKSMLEMVERLGGDKDMKVMNIAGAFGLQGNIAAARRLYQNRAELMKGSISMQEVDGKTGWSDEGIYSLGKEQTSKYSKSTAEIENAFIKDVVKAVDLVGEKMVDLFGDMTDQLKDYIVKKLTHDDGVKTNTLARPAGTTRNEPAAIWVR